MGSAAVIQVFQIAILFAFFTIICGQCEITFSENLFQRPNLFRIIGKNKIKLALSDHTTYLSLFEKQKIEVVCETEFESPEYYNKVNSISIECIDNNFRFSPGYRYFDGLLKCSPLKWKLYETSKNFVWCPNNVTSYLLARPKTDSVSGYEYLAGVCYDTYANSLKTLYYKMTPKHNANFHPTLLEQFYSPSIEIEHHRDIFTKRSVEEKNYNNYIFKDWIGFSKYNLSSILQIPYINSKFYAGSFLDIIWWPSLRLGNWKRYEMALEKHIENANKSYDILAGVSGVVKAPIIESCATNFTLKVLNDDLNRQIPLYVWNYLRATDNSSEIVIIGVNSPFYEFYKKKDVIFCKDKCQEISWLKEKTSTFRYSSLGIIFCCSVDEVKSSEHLDGFPIIDMDSLPPPLVPVLPTTIIPINEYEKDLYNMHY